jgi:hypothetical protein
MTLDHDEPQTETAGSPALRLEIAGEEDKTPCLIPVFIRNLSTGGVTLAVRNPGNIFDWEQRRGEACVLRVEDPGGGEPIKISATITWTRSGGPGQPPLSVGLHLMKPPGEAISRLSNLLPHTSQDIKGLWDRYDQVRKIPENNSDWVHQSYMIGVALLLAGLVLQLTGSPGYQGWSWVLWLLGSLGIAGKIVRPFWPKQPVSDRIGRSL